VQKKQEFRNDVIVVVPVTVTKSLSAAEIAVVVADAMFVPNEAKYRPINPRTSVICKSKHPHFEVKLNETLTRRP
jgi:hypothetical protein